MVAFARRSTANYSRHDVFDSDETYAFDELTPGERVCPPPYRSRSAAVIRVLVFVLIVAGGGWMLLNDRASWPWWLDAATDISGIERWLGHPDGQLASASEGARSPAFEDSAATLANRPMERLDTDETAPAEAIPALEPARVEAAIDVVTLNETNDPADVPAVEQASEEAAALPDEEGSADEPEPERLPPPHVDPDNPFQQRALAVGLHPGLSRVLLERMSPADYRNAGIAIQKALKQPNDAVVVWPRQRKPELALFRVRFVPGAAPDCRRYVVTITKDGWTTTALPMEKCGSRTASLSAAD